MNFLSSPFNLSNRPVLGVRGEEVLDDGAGEKNRDLRVIFCKIRISA